MTWLPLHCHSQYSILDSTCSIEALIKQATSFDLPALALTDSGNMYGTMEFYQECFKNQIKPILGSQVYLAPESRFNKKKSPNSKIASKIILLCKDNNGYKNLCYLSSIGFIEGFYYYPRIDKDLLKQFNGGLICLSGSLSSPLFEAFSTSEEKLKEEIFWFLEIFKDDFYLELQRHHMSEEKISEIEEDWLKQEYFNFIETQNKYNETLLQLSAKYNIRCVATNDTHYLNPEDWFSHEILLNLQLGITTRISKNDSYIPNPKRKIYKSREFYFKSPLEMSVLFHDLPHTLAESLKIAEKCNVSFDLSKSYYPIFIPEDFFPKQNYSEKDRDHASVTFLTKLCYDNIDNRYTPFLLEIIQSKFPDQNPKDIVLDRLKIELDVIVSKGFYDYLLIVWDIINWTKSQQIPLGPGRGSGAGSVILFLLGITDIEPIRFDLFFERFINPERPSYPDIDIDICMTGRERVINYTTEKYGKNNVAQIITFGTMKAKMAIKDVARVLDFSTQKSNLISKYIPDNTSLEKALSIDPDLYNLYIKDDESKIIIDLAKKLEGCIRNTGVHAAGVIICGQPLTDLIPVCLPRESSMITTQFSMKPLEKAGMLKVDFLGLKTLSSIKIAITFIKNRTGKNINCLSLSLEDKATFKLLQQGKTLGVFQMESSGMQELARQLQPDKFEEIIAMGALYRPGPMDMIPSFINRKHKREPIEYDHPLLENILKETYGIMVYQEQVMQIAGTIAKYSLGEGDVLRRAMGKKDANQMIKEREKFCSGAYNQNIPENIASNIFDKMEKFASYGFNKSHAAAYGLLTYVTAYLKANYPKEWMASLLTCDYDDIEKVGKLIREAQSMNINILPPDINESNKDFVATDSGIRFSLCGIKGVGKGCVESILEKRTEKGFFVDIYDFITKVDLKKITKKNVENLIHAGCFDFTNKHRDLLLHELSHVYDRVLKDQKELSEGVLSLFSIMPENKLPSYPQLDPSQFRGEKEILKKEKDLIGFYLTGHPLSQNRALLDRLSCVPFSEVLKMPHNTVTRIAFMIDNFYTKLSLKGQKKFAILKISDGNDTLELPLWSKLFEEKGHLLEEDKVFYTIITVEKKEGTTKLFCQWLEELKDVTEEKIATYDAIYDNIKKQTLKKISFKQKAMTETKDLPSETLKIKLDVDSTRFSTIMKIKDLFNNHPGTTEVEFVFTKDSAPCFFIKVGKNFRVTPSLDLEKEIKNLLTNKD